MEVRDMLALWDRFETSAATELKVSADGTELYLKKEAASPAGEKGSGEGARRGAFAEAEAATTAMRETGADENAITAPLTGTFYRASSPEEPAFVSVGQLLRKGDVIGVIEAMKTYNEIKADKEGIVQEISAEDGQLVEYGQPLVLLG